MNNEAAERAVTGWREGLERRKGDGIGGSEAAGRAGVSPKLFHIINIIL